MKTKHPPGPAMTLGNMREMGVQNLIASCVNDACRHTALIDAWSYPAETEIPYFRRHVVCAKCGMKTARVYRGSRRRGGVAACGARAARRPGDYSAILTYRGMLSVMQEQAPDEFHYRVLSRSFDRRLTRDIGSDFGSRR
jgi:hypothetical protein